MLEFLNHHGLELMVANFIYNSAVQAMPSLDGHYTRAYEFLYKFAHGLAGNWRLVAR
jgi:hypothetical protein